MEYQNYGGRATLGVTLGAIGTGLSVLNGGLGNLGIGYGRNSNIEGQQYVTKDELDYVQTISAKDSEISILKSENFTNDKIADVYSRLKADLNSFEKEQSAWNSAQMVNNATMSSAIAVNSNSISALQNCCNQLTKIVIPADNVCPKPMPLLNSWTAPTTPTTAASGSN